ARVQRRTQLALSDEGTGHFEVGHRQIVLNGEILGTDLGQVCEQLARLLGALALLARLPEPLVAACEGHEHARAPALEFCRSGATAGYNLAQKVFGGLEQE